MRTQIEVRLAFDTANSALHNPLLYNSFPAFSPPIPHFLLIPCLYSGKPVFLLR
ncbi:hypothetical protein HNR39_003486 [Glaciimonas immobilis]|uniref:Uncharacterized protein n=1 Tax=Glaciimonas immobilis TaxID=728004 RepID=A0A840RVK8_9BURK|nr:hypothetical protein [Glaciimonas immobilis]